MEATSEPGSAGKRTMVDRHDHAWRKVGLNQSGEHLLVGEYACDLCDAVWAL
jgi:hypothetical protein